MCLGMCVFVPRWVEPQRHTVITVCVYVCVCNSIPLISPQALKLSARNFKASTTWYSLAANLTRFLIYRCILEL